MICCKSCRRELEEALFYDKKTECKECYNLRRRNSRKSPLCKRCKKEYQSEGRGRYRYCSTICRFMDKVRKDEETGCWNWHAGRTRKGYGNFQPVGEKSGLAHRVSYELFKGKIKKDLHVLHSCNNPSCVNPEHLRTGTNADNINDKVLAGRGNQPRGEKHHGAKLSNLDIKMIRTLGDEGYTYSNIAKVFGVTPETISHITKRKGWRHV